MNQAASVPPQATPAVTGNAAKPASKAGNHEHHQHQADLLFAAGKSAGHYEQGIPARSAAASATPEAKRHQRATVELTPLTQVNTPQNRTRRLASLVTDAGGWLINNARPASNQTTTSGRRKRNESATVHSAMPMG